jgi:predicted HTH domain antitoxin
MKIELDIHEALLNSSKYTERDVRMILGVALYNRDVASIGKTAEIVGVGRREFQEEMGKYGGELYHGYKLEDLLKDSENAGKY